MANPTIPPPIDPDAARQLLRQYLESLRAAGVEQLPQARGDLVLPPPPEPPATVSAAPEQSAAVLPAAESPAAESAAPADSSPAPPRAAEPVAVAENLFEQGDLSEADTLEQLQSEVAQCTLCDELARTRTQTVFGVGNPQARLCFLGEAPGAEEDRQGEPFVGRSGQLLTKILAACNLTRDDVYILNILKCRPPGNRDPLPEESSNCRRYLNRQLQLIAPEFICCLGGVAAQNLLETTTPIGRLRGKVHDYRGIHVVCTYHPAYLLRTPSAKKETWEDMKLLMREMGTPVG